jgi:hypothetical protein
MSFKAKGSFKNTASETKSTNQTKNVNWFKQTPELMEEAKNSTRTSRSKYLRTDILTEFKLRDYNTEGINKIRILPINLEIWPDAKNFGLLVWVHPSLGDNFETHLCPERMKKGPCPVCDHSRELDASGSASDKKLSIKYKPKSKIIYLIVDRNNEDGEVQFFPASWSKVGLAVHNLQTNPEDGSVRQIVHPEEGRDILIQYNKPPRKASNADLQNIYPPNCVSLKEQITPVNNSKALDFVSKNAIPDLIVYSSYEELQKALFGETDVVAEAVTQQSDDEDNEPSITSTQSIDTDSLTFEQVREMTDDELSQILRDNDVSESDIEDMTSAEKRKMIRDNLDL